MLKNKNKETITTKKDQYTYRIHEGKNKIWHWSVTDRKGETLSGGNHASRTDAVSWCEFDANMRKKTDNE